MNQNKEQDFLDSPEYKVLLGNVKDAYYNWMTEDATPENNTQDKKDQAEQALKTFIRDNIVIGLSEIEQTDSEVLFQKVCDQRLFSWKWVKKEEPMLYNIIMIALMCARSQPQIKFPSEEDFKTAAKNPDGGRFWEHGWKKAIQRIKELNQLGN